MKKTANCGELNEKRIGETAVLNGWVWKRRDHGKLIFIDLQDREGLTQLVFNPEEEKKAFETGQNLRAGYVISVKGKVLERLKGTENKSMPTGKIEIHIEEAEILNKSKPLPFELDATPERLANEDTRLKYRYLDLRRPEMQKNIILRHKVMKAFRDYFDERGFLEIETPFMANSTPEGARDYLIPVRNPKGTFFALPQSPQIYKQLLMVSGFEKYFQIVRCMRDEDLRADRQPEFTQYDMEMSFANEEDILKLVEESVAHTMKEVFKKDAKTPFQRITWVEAMRDYGLDKPDTRFEMKLIELTGELENSSFKVFSDTAKNGGIIKAIVVPKGGEMGRKQVDKLQDFAKLYKAKGLVSIKVLAAGKIESPSEKFIGENEVKSILQKTKATEGDLILIVADSFGTCNTSLGMLRNKLGKELGLIDANKLNFLFVTEFPMFEFNEETKQWGAAHHPFTAPHPEDLDKLETNKKAVRSRAYDLVLNGTELGSGSIRIHDKETQEKVFKALGLSPEQIKRKFGFLLEACEFGYPPEGGMALGMDRFMALVLNTESIRDVVAFPKNKHGQAVMEGAPSEVSEAQLKELGIKVDWSNEELVKKQQEKNSKKTELKK
ncbi:MAG: aspartate--tRNA ligase [archaeon]|jgi:aspartyl-tRNA synthetase